jgi:glycosyltransferase involved in cell wall biosynthesis
LVVSKREGLPLVILEAMSMGVPVISTNVGAIDEVVQNGLNGFLIESGNGTNAIIASFASTILELLADQNKNRSLASKARETVNSGFSLETMCSKYQHVLDELIE